MLGLVPLVWCSPLAASEGQPKKRPNIIYIRSDDHACAAVGCYDQWLSKHAPTPNIDKLAKQGMRFTQYAVTNSICTPSRAAILTGQYSHKNGVYTLNDRLEPKRDHFIKRLLNALYQTAIIGKWHLLADPVGFAYWNILSGQGRYIDPILRAKGEKGKVYKGYSEDVITDLALKCIVVQVAETEWYIAVAPVAQPGAYAANSKPLGKRQAFRVCKELNELEQADWSEATRAAMRPPPPVCQI